MPWLALLAALLLSAPAAGEEPPPDQRLLFFNARLALREGKADEALKLWLLHNVLQNRGQRGADEEEFRSVVWAALGALGLCQDGYFRDDEGGAGLWPLALHNWVIHAITKGPPFDQQSPFDAFDVARQQRFISLHDVLSEPELRSAKFFRGPCRLARSTMEEELPELPGFDPRDRFSAGLLLRYLLESSLRILVRAKVESVAAIEARIFDLDLALANMQARKARQAAFAAKQKAKTKGVSEVGVKEVRDRAAAWPTDSPQAAFLRKCFGWQTSEWMILSRPRRLFLFAQARPFAPDPATVDRLILSIIDALIERKEGVELESWIGFLDAGGAASRREALCGGERGKRLLELDPSTGFRERAAIALHRGVGFLESGQRQEALRAFAYAMSSAEDSRDPATTTALARRWLSFVLARYQTTDEVIATLKALVPKQEYNAVVEDLAWTAALRADLSSFDRVVASTRRGGAFDARAERLRLLAAGKAGELATLLRDGTIDEPYLTMRFIKQLFERIELEEADVRAANASMLEQVVVVLETSIKGGRGAQVRQTEELLIRGRALLEGLGRLDRSVEGRARALSPGHEAFAGNIRLAPADPLPWPFRAPEPEAPSPFVPLLLQPLEWRDANGALVFGWRISE